MVQTWRMIRLQRWLELPSSGSRWLLPVEWLALFIGAVLLLRSPLGMDDFFYQARSGEYLLQTGRVLAVNLFSFTAPEHPTPSLCLRLLLQNFWVL